MRSIQCREGEHKPSSVRQQLKAPVYRLTCSSHEIRFRAGCPSFVIPRNIYMLDFLGVNSGVILQARPHFYGSATEGCQ